MFLDENNYCFSCACAEGFWGHKNGEFGADCQANEAIADLPGKARDALNAYTEIFINDRKFMIKYEIISNKFVQKNHSRPKKLAEMLPKCSRTLLVKLTARIRRAKHVLEQLNKKTLPVLVLLSIKLLQILKLEFIRQ